MYSFYVFSTSHYCAYELVLTVNIFTHLLCYNGTSMNSIQKIINRIDRFQRKRRPLAFGFAVIKKYGDDQAGFQAALVTYYGFLALFPLLLILTTVASILGQRDPELGSNLVESVSSYFPVIGQSLDDSIRTGTRTGLALVIGLLFAAYGARGIADAFRNAVNHIWHVPLGKRSGFPRAQLRSFALIFGGGFGFLAAAIIAGWTVSVGHGIGFKLLSILLNVLILYGVFLFILRVSLPLSIKIRQFQVSAVVAAIGIAALQLLGSAILKHSAQTLNNSYSTLFATTLGLLAWIYLLAQVVMYAVVIATVRDKKLWPRGITGDNPTDADKYIERHRGS